MAEKKELERFIQRGEGVEITKIPPENLAYIRQQQEKEKQDPPNKK